MAQQPKDGFLPEVVRPYELSRRDAGLVIGDELLDSRLLAMGLTPSWLLSVLGIQAGVVVGVGLAAGVVAGILGIVIVTDSYLVLSVPVVPIVLSCVAVVVAAGLATASAVRALTAVESPDVT